MLISRTTGSASIAPELVYPDVEQAGDGLRSHGVLVKVEDVDAHHEHAREHGARILSPPTDYPYGERQYSVEDLAGHHWTFTQAIADLAPEDWGGTSARAT
jgi:uncharacterized glyoxalase superfamily protein PhnB